MSYEYTGYLKTVLHKPDPELQNQMVSIDFGSEDLMLWTTCDRKSAKEWMGIPVRCTRTGEGVQLEGVFRDVFRIDNLQPDDPRYWVPLGTLGWKDDRFPIDASTFPVVELTYRCTSRNARPAWSWHYSGGVIHDELRPTYTWRTVARLLPHFGFPRIIDNLVFRLYSPTRSTESFEIKSVSFRKMTPAEEKACGKDEVRLASKHSQGDYRVLNGFLPIGTYLSAESAQRLSQTLGLSLDEYWDFVLQDLVMHNHNAISLSKADSLSPDELCALARTADAQGIKLSLTLKYPLGDTLYRQREFINKYIAPLAESDAILAWNVSANPTESDLYDLLKAKELIGEIDNRHPLSVVTKHPDAYPLFAPLFSVTGIGHDASHEPWEAGHLVRTHEPLKKHSHFWLTSPAFVHTTETPEWSICSEMRLMVNHCFANGGKGWFTYCYHNEPIWVRGNCQRSLTGPFLTFSDLWEELGVRAERFNAIAPLLLGAECEGLLKKWYVTRIVAHTDSQVPENVPPAAVYRLRGRNYSIYCLVSNDVRATTSVNISIPESSLRGREIYDLSAFVETWRWDHVPRKVHMELFPGQMHMFLVADPDVCMHWRDVIAGRIIRGGLRRIAVDLQCARNHSLDSYVIEKLVEGIEDQPAFTGLPSLMGGRDAMVDLLSSSAGVTETRNRLVAASAALCGCDGVLCRMFGRNKADEARQQGPKVLELARELICLRMELRAGKGAEIAKQCDSLARRTVRLLNEFRALTK